MKLGSFERFVKGATLLALFVLVVALSVFVVSMVSLVRTAEKTVAGLPAQIDRQVADTRTAAVGAINDTRRDTLAEIASIRTDVLSRVDSLSAMADTQLTGIRSQVLGEVDEIRKTADTRLGDTLARVDTLSDKIDPVMANVSVITGHVASVTAHLDDALPQFTDCAYLDEAGNPVGGNQDCAFNRFQGVSKAFEQMAQAGAKAAPQVAESVVGIAKSVDGIAADAHTATSDFVAPRTTWQKIKSWLETAGKIGARFL